MSAHIAELHFYPVKGCSGFSVQEAQLAPTGLRVNGIGDREWVVVDGSGRFVSQREVPRMALIRTGFASECLTLKAPGMLPLHVPLASEGDVLNVTVWNDTIAAVTQGEVVDQWMSKFLDRPCRLMRFDPLARRNSDPQYVGQRDAPYLFADAFAYLILGQSALVDLNRRLTAIGHGSVSIQRFRPNIVLGDLEAHEEDYVQRFDLPESRVSLSVVKPCARCTVPGVDPETAEQTTSVPDLLASYRGKDGGVMFGVNAVADLTSLPHIDPHRDAAWPRIRVGDPIEITLAFD